MKNNWKEYYNKCNESNEQTLDANYHSTNSKRAKYSRKGKWREIEIIKEQQKLRRELMDLLDYC